MKLIITDIIETAGLIINNEGIDALKVDLLARKMGIDRIQLLPLLKKDDDILMLVLLTLENDIQQSINNVKEMDLTPEKELHYLFKKLYQLFNQKTYYLHVIFSTEMIEKDNTIQIKLTGIREIAKAYLFRILEQGKETEIFSRKVGTNHLVKWILGSFRLLMSDIQLTNKMIRDLKILRENPDSL